MKKLLFILLAFPLLLNAQEESKIDKFKQFTKKTFKFSTFYGAVNGGNSISDVDIYSVTNGLQTQTVQSIFKNGAR